MNIFDNMGRLSNISKIATINCHSESRIFPPKRVLFCVPCPSRLARLQAPPSLSLLSSLLLSSACIERISCEDDFRAGMDVRVLFEGENRSAADRKGSDTNGEAGAERTRGSDIWRRWRKETFFLIEAAFTQNDYTSVHL